MDARTGSIDTPLEAPIAGKPKWFRRPVTKGFLAAFLLGLIAVTVLQDIYLSWRQQYWLDSANIPWSTGDIAAMQHGSARAAAAIPEFRGIPNVTVSYYDIDATDVTGIRWALYAAAIHGDGSRHSALSTWSFNWTWGPAPDGGCGVANAQVSFRAHVTLPRITNPQSLDPDAAQLWRSFNGALIRHEAHHVRDAYNGRGRVIQALRRSNCAYADRAGQWAIDELLREAQAFDRSVERGAAESTAFGWGWRGPRGGWQGPADS